jgi:localization factor PodJL
MAQQKAPLTVDNGSVETTSGDLPENGQKAGTPTPSIEANSRDPRPAPAAAAPRTGAAAVQSGSKAGGLQGLSDHLDTTGETQVVPQDAALRSPGVAPMKNPLGMAVTPTSAVPDNSDLARMRRERNMASLANQIAAVQANAPTLPASMLPDNGGRAILASADGAVPTDTAAPSEMPPAQIGPISLRTAAQKGDPSAEFEVAARFAEGRGVAQDFKQANAWYSRAAQRGFAPAQYRLGTLFERGIGTKADVARAKVWYGRAAEQGHVKAMHNLAVLNSGREQSADYAMAVHWFTAAAERGLADSQYNLGVLYESGLGMPRDLKQAYHWLSLAARNGDKEAARRRDAIRMKLEEGEVAAADAVVENWRAQASDPVVNEARAAGEMWKQRQAAAR